MPAKARVMSPQSSSQTSPLLSVKSYSTKASGTTLPCDSSRTIIPFTTISEDNDWWLFGDDNFSYDLLGLRRHQADAATTPTFKDATSETRNKCDSDENNSNSNRVFESPPQSDSFRNDLKNYNAPKYVGNFSMKVLIDSKIFGPPLKRPDCVRLVVLAAWLSLHHDLQFQVC
tara:strand:+ start:347 stop:865 length:519 start_codon:yes stop_codon:yes gene_type:complete